MPKRMKLSSDAVADYAVIGIACHLKDYRVAFLLNSKMRFHFNRITDLVIREGEAGLHYSLYEYLHKDERRSYFLIENHHPEGRLVSDQKGVDYFLVVNDVLDPARVKALVKAIQEIPQVLAAFPIDVSKIRNAQNLFEELELQLLDQKKSRKMA